MSLLKCCSGRVVDGLPDPATASILSWSLRVVFQGLAVTSAPGSTSVPARDAALGRESAVPRIDQAAAELFIEVMRRQISLSRPTDSAIALVLTACIHQSAALASLSVFFYHILFLTVWIHQSVLQDPSWSLIFLLFLRLRAASRPREHKNTNTVLCPTHPLNYL